MKYILGPDINSPLEELLTADLSSVDRVLIYNEHLTADVPNQYAQPDLPNGVGPNCYPALRDLDFFRRISKQLIVESPCIKDWSVAQWRSGATPKPWSEPARVTLLGRQRILDAGGEEPIISLDEPWTDVRPVKGPPLMSPDECTAFVIEYCRALVAGGVTAIEICESYPWNRQFDIRRWTDSLLKAGLPVVGLRIDPDHRKIKASDRLDMRAIANQCRSWNLPLSMIVTPGDVHDDIGTLTTMEVWVTDPNAGIRALMQSWPDLCFQSWAGCNRPPISSLLNLLVRNKSFVEAHP